MISKSSWKYHIGERESYKRARNQTAKDAYLPQRVVWTYMAQFWPGHKADNRNVIVYYV